MKKISAFVLASSVVLGSSAAFAGGMVEAPVEQPPVVVDGGSSSALPLWAILGGVVAVGAVLSASN